MSESNKSCCGGCASGSTCNGTVPPSAVADPRVFRHGAIKARMLARIGSVDIDGRRPLDGLGTRDDDDPAIALIDAAAGAIHVLAWNAARLFDDGTLRRTEDRDALVDMTRLLGYEPRPALAATTTLAFTVDQFEGAPKVAKVPKGTKVASVPGQDEKPQIFETDSVIEARVEWNALKPVLQKTVPPVTAQTATITISGTGTSIKPGDLLLVYLEPQASPNNWLCARVRSVTPEPDTDPPRTSPARTRIDLASSVALPAPAALRGDTFKSNVIVLGARAAAFGATAPDIALMSTEVRTTNGAQKPANSGNWEWTNLTMPSGGTASVGSVDLDALYADAMANRFVVFRTDGKTQMGRITGSTEIGRKGFGLAAKVSRVDVEGINLASDGGFFDKVRETAIYIESSREKLLTVDADIAMPADGAPRDCLVVQGSVSLPPGRRLVLSGNAWTELPGNETPIAEVVTLQSANAAGENTELVFENPISSAFRSTTLSLLANCVGASHGETSVSGAELIGSGNSSVPFPRYLLQRSPLAYLPATNARGYAPAIEVRVGERTYTESATLFGLGSEDRAYTVKPVRDGKSEIQFAGRLPSGTYNINALYKTGGGKAGLLPAGRITTIMTPVIGVGKATNPVSADGASDAETVEEMRNAAPQSIRTLDRVVSLADFEAFARTRRGVGKALATELRMGMRSVVCLTIATTGLAAPTAGSDVVDSLRRALALVTVPGRSVRIEGFIDLTAQITVALAIDPAFRRADVEAAARTLLGQKFGRANRRFGEPLHRSAVLAALHDVEGVTAVQLVLFTVFQHEAIPPDSLTEKDGRLPCPVPTMDGDNFKKAGLLSIDPARLQFQEMLP